MQAIPGEIKTLAILISNEMPDENTDQNTILPTYRLTTCFSVYPVISQNLTCHTIGIIYKVEEFRSPVSVQQCWNCQNFGHSAKSCKSKTKCLICGESYHHKGYPNREKKQPNCANCKGPHVASYKRCPAYKIQAFRQHVVDNQKSYAAILHQNMALRQSQDKTFTFSAEQLVKFVANVAIQVAQP